MMGTPHASGSPTSAAAARPGRRTRYRFLPVGSARAQTPPADPSAQPVPKPGPYTPGPHPKEAA